MPSLSPGRRDDGIRSRIPTNLIREKQSPYLEIFRRRLPPTPAADYAVGADSAGCPARMRKFSISTNTENAIAK